MSKEIIKRDKNGRFAKKDESARKGISTKEYITLLEKERDMYKRLSERLGSDYINKCAELGEVKRDLKAYEKAWPKLMAKAKSYKNRANKMYDYNLILLDAIRASAAEMDWLRDRIPFWRKLILHEEMHEWDEYLESLCSKAEGLYKE